MTSSHTEMDVTFTETPTAASAAPASRRERKQKETRQRIFRAAMKLFARQGIGNTTVEEITEAADVGKGTFFNYFPTKEHLLGVLMEIQLGKVAQAERAAESGELPIREVLQQFMRGIVEEPSRSRQLARGLILTVTSSEAVRAMMVEAFTRGRAVLTGVLQRGQQQGEIRRDLKAADMARVFQQTMLGTVLLWSLQTSENILSLLEPTFEIYWAGIGTDHSGQAS